MILTYNRDRVYKKIKIKLAQGQIPIHSGSDPYWQGITVVCSIFLSTQ